MHNIERDRFLPPKKKKKSTSSIRLTLATSRVRLLFLRECDCFYKVCFGAASKLEFNSHQPHMLLSEIRLHLRRIKFSIISSDSVMTRKGNSLLGVVCALRHVANPTHFCYLHVDSLFELQRSELISYATPYCDWHSSCFNFKLLLSICFRMPIKKKLVTRGLLIILFCAFYQLAHPTICSPPMFASLHPYKVNAGLVCPRPIFLPCFCFTYFSQIFKTRS